MAAGTEALDARRQPHRPDAAFQERPGGLDRVLLAFAGDEPGAAEGTAKRGGVGEILVVESLAVPLVARAHVFPLHRHRSGTPQEFRADTPPPAVHVEVLEERVAG